MFSKRIVGNQRYCANGREARKQTPKCIVLLVDADEHLPKSKGLKRQEQDVAEDLSNRDYREEHVRALADANPERENSIKRERERRTNGGNANARRSRIR